MVCPPGPHHLDLIATARRRPLVVTPVQEVGADRFAAMVDSIDKRLASDRKLLVLIEQPRASWLRLAGYVAALRAGHAVSFLDGVLPERAAALRAAFAPDVILRDARGPDEDRHRLLAEDATVLAVPQPEREHAPLHPELALLMWSSGSTGDPKAVRLSYRNLAVNAASIAEVTDIDPDHRVASSLPWDYTFGLSLITSHLFAGAGVALTTALPSSPRFVYDAAAAAITTTGLVPATAGLLARQGWSPVQVIPTLQSVLISGGATPAVDLLALDARMRSTRGRVYSMYGQAEATARISCLPPDLLAARPRSVGYPVPGCAVRIVDSGGVEVAAGDEGEIEVAGEQVMMGYARGRSDCAVGDECGESWRTGDRGRVDEGLLYVRGRLDRHAKILGRGVDLDDTELAVTDWLDGRAAALVVGERVVVFSTAPAGTLSGVNQRLAARLDLPSRAVQVRSVASLPLTGSGKVDYQRLRSLS